MKYGFEKNIYTRKLTSELLSVNDFSRSSPLILIGFVKFVLNLLIRILTVQTIREFREPHEILLEYHEFSYPKIDDYLTSLNDF